MVIGHKEKEQKPWDNGEIRKGIWQQLQQAVSNPGDPWRTPVLATVDEQGLPDARTLVLRAADADTETLTFFSDQRSPKIAQLQQQPQSNLLFWCPRRQWQLRVRALARIETNSPQTINIWRRIRQSAAAGDYLTPEPPGTPLAEDSPDFSPCDKKEHGQKEQAQMEDDQRHHLCLIHLKVRHIDWLSLSDDGHRRAFITDQQLTWLTP